MIYADHKLIQNLKIEQTKEPRGSTEQNKTRIKRTHKKKKEEEYCDSFWKEKA